MLVYVILLLALLAPSALVAAETKGIGKCSGNTPIIPTITVKDCLATPCIAKPGATFTIEIAGFDFNLAPIVHLKAVNDVTKPIELACDISKIQFVNPLPEKPDCRLDCKIPSSYPPNAALIEVTLSNLADQPNCCANIPFQIQP